MKLRLFLIASIVLGASGVLYWMVNRPVELADLIRETGSKNYNVLVITIDTLRADRLGCYGFEDISTPNIDALAASGVRFTDTTAHVPLTLPSHTSIFTGKFPALHGVHDNGGFYVRKEELTLAENFKQKGFVTAAFVAAYVLDSSWGLNQGFDTYFDNFDLNKEEQVGLGSVQRSGDEVNEHAMQWLNEHRNEQFFLWMHFYDPHTPYEPPPDYDKMYQGRPYIAEIAYTDSVVGKLLKHLGELGLRDRTIIVLTGDHGESLGEHGESTHAFFIYDATLRVPLILSLPDKQFQGHTVMQQARSIDIYPTLLQLSGVSVPETIQGRSLLHLMLDSGKFEAPASYAEAYYPQYHFGWSRLLSLRTSNYKYIDAPRPELYDLKSDPGEHRNIYFEKKDVAERMKSELKEIENRKGEKAVMDPGAVDDETHEKLAALGYVGAFSGPVDADPLTLSDPKDKIDLFNRIVDARKESLAGNGDQAINQFQQVIAIDPKIVDAHFMLGNELFRKERYPEALEAFKTALSLKPDYDFAMINIANTYRRMGKTEEALVGFEHFLQKNPENTQILYHIGEIYLSRKEPDRAMEYFQRALKVESDTSWVHNSIGVAYIQKNEPRKAEQYFHKALELNPEINMAHFNLAQLRESQGNLAEAEQEYLAEIKVSPKNFKAQFNLGRLYISQRRMEEGIRYLDEAVKQEPKFALGYLFLAQAYVENGRDLDKAIEFAKKGLSLNPDPEYRPLGHLVLADVYNRLGQHDLERAELAAARQKTSPQ